MSKVKLMIEIEEDYYELIKADVKSGNDYKPCVLIANGTPITEGDLISRSALKEKYLNLLDSAKELGTQVGPYFIDNAPTVTPEKALMDKLRGDEND